MKSVIYYENQLQKIDSKLIFRDYSNSITMAYKKIRKTITKKRYAFTIYDGKCIRTIRVRANDQAQGKEKLKQAYSEWQILRELELVN